MHNGRYSSFHSSFVPRFCRKYQGSYLLGGLSGHLKGTAGSEVSRRGKGHSRSGKEEGGKSELHLDRASCVEYFLWNCHVTHVFHLLGYDSKTILTRTWRAKDEH